MKGCSGTWGGCRAGAGRKPGQARLRLVARALGLSHTTERWVKSGSVFKIEHEVGAGGKRLPRKVLAFPDTAPEQLVCISREIVTSAGCSDALIVLIEAGMGPSRDGSAR